MANLTVTNKQPRRDRLDEPFVVRAAIMWSGKLYKPGYKIPKDMRKSPTLRMHYWLRRMIVPVADVTSGLRARHKAKETQEAPPVPPSTPPSEPPADQAKGDGTPPSDPPGDPPSDPPSDPPNADA